MIRSASAPLYLALFLALGIAAACAIGSEPAGGFHIKAVNDQSLGLWEGDKPVLVYNHGMIAKPEAPGPTGLWLTEKHESKVRIQECGNALCGSVEGKPNEKVLVDMQPGKKNHWDGKIIDTRNGSTYEGHVTLKNADALRVEGCTFAGLFCGGETWTRIQ